MMNKLSIMMLVSITTILSYAADENDGFFGANRTYKGPYKVFESDDSLGPDDLARFSAPKYRLGALDKLMLRKVIAEKGWEALKLEIEQYQFRKYKMVEESNGVERGFKIDTPYTITQCCTRSDNTEIANKVFGELDSKYKTHVATLYANPLNDTYQGYERIDHCTSAMLPNNTSVYNNPYTSEVNVTTMFFDKPSLLAALEALKS